MHGIRLYKSTSLVFLVEMYCEGYSASMHLLTHPLITSPSVASRVHYKYLDILGMIWMACIIVGNLIAGKTFTMFGLDITSALLIYPVTYIFSDIFTEVYGYRASRRIVWTGFGMLLFMGVIMNIAAHIPPSAAYTDNAAFVTIFGSGYIVMIAAVCSFFCGEFANAYTLAKVKILTKGNHLWMRTLSSTLVGENIDGCIFFLIAGTFAFGMSISESLLIGITGGMSMVLYEALATPLTYRVIAFLKEKEGLDVYDIGTNFNPFSLR